MYSYKNFYNSFQVNYFDYKQSVNEYLMSKSGAELKGIAGQMLNYEEKSFKRAIKMDARKTYLMAVDTFFELIFALLPNKKLQLMDEKIVEQLSRKNQYIHDLKKYIDKKPCNFNKIKNAVINYTNNKSSNLVRYLFFLGIFETEHEDLIEESVASFEEAIDFFAKEILENREELNSFKHGLRLIPFMYKLEISNPADKNEKISIDMGDSLSFQTFNSQGRIIHH